MLRAAQAMIASSRSSEASSAGADLRPGFFTYYLLEGLEGAADLDRDGIVSLQELYEYVERQVLRKSRAVGGVTSSQLSQPPRPRRYATSTSSSAAPNL